MERLGDILRRRPIRTNTYGENTGAWSSAEGPEAAAQEKVCPLCKGAGFVYSGAPLGDPAFGKAVPCRCTLNDWEKKRREYLSRYSNLGPLARFTFEALSTGGTKEDKNPARFAFALKLAREFAAEPKGWLVFLGPSGCGKTRLAAAIANFRLGQGYPAVFSSVPDLLDHLRSTFGPQSEITYDEFFEQVKNAPLLILDDLGTQTTSPWAREKLDQLINHRFNLRLPTVVTSATPLEEMEERLRTRLADTELCQVCQVQKWPTPGLERMGGLELEALKNMTFDNFDRRRVNLRPDQSQNLEQAFQLARGFAEVPEGWLIFQGVNGCGKTHLAAAVANYRYQKGEPVLFLVVPDFLDYLRSAFGPDSRVTYDELFERTKRAPLIILDDFGEQATTPWAQEKLYQLINYRYNARLPTVITTCRSLDEIEPRLSSRMVDPRVSLVFNITAPDFRGDSTPPAEARSARYRPGRRR